MLLLSLAGTVSAEGANPREAVLSVTHLKSLCTMSIIDQEAENNYEKQCYTKICSMKNNWMMEFVDERKVIASGLLAHAVRFLVRHCETHREQSKISSLVSVFKERENRLFLSYWLCERLGLKCFMDGDAVRFKMSGTPPNPEIGFKDEVRKFLKNGLQSKKVSKTSGRSAPETKLAEIQPAKKRSSRTRADKASSAMQEESKKIDMLDSWYRLPGSYGTGKRR